jgi:EamA domain-containing membrane protein RarD
MKSEMDVMAMTPQDRLFWLKANRVTLLVVGLVWIGIIIQQLTVGRMPWFMIAMIPFFASVRFGCYLVLRQSARQASG